MGVFNNFTKSAGSVTKNLGRSGKLAAYDWVKEKLGGSSDVVTDVRDSFDIIKEEATDVKKLFKEKIVDNILKKATENTLKAVKTGNLVRSEEDKDKAVMESMGMGDMFGDGDDSDDDEMDFSVDSFDDDDSSSDDSSGSTTNNLTKSKNVTNTIVNKPINKTLIQQKTDSAPILASQQIATKMAIISSKAIQKSVERSNQYLERSTELGKEQIDVTYKIVTEIQGTQDHRLKMVASQFEIANQLGEVNKALQVQLGVLGVDIDGEKLSKANTLSSKYDGAFDEYGTFSASGYVKALKEKFVEQIDSVEMLKDMFVNPLEMATSLMIDKLVPQGLTDSLERFDKIFSSIPANIMLTMEDWANIEDEGAGNKVKNIIGKIFGVDTTTSASTDSAMAGYDRGPVPFDGMTKKAITEVIPGFLSQILRAIEGGEESSEQIYDYDKGRMRSKGQIIEEVNRKKMGAATEMGIGSDLKSSIMGKIDMSDPAQERAISQEIDRIMTRVAMQSGKFTGKIENLSGLDSSLTDMVTGEYGALGRSSKSEFNKEKMATRGSIGQTFDSIRGGGAEGSAERQALQSVIQEKSVKEEALENKIESLEKFAKTRGSDSSRFDKLMAGMGGAIDNKSTDSEGNIIEGNEQLYKYEEMARNFNNMKKELKDLQTARSGEIIRMQGKTKDTSNVVPPTPIRTPTPTGLFDEHGQPILSSPTPVNEIEDTHDPIGKVTLKQTDGVDVTTDDTAEKAAEIIRDTSDRKSATATIVDMFKHPVASLETGILRIGDTIGAAFFGKHGDREGREPDEGGMINWFKGKWDFTMDWFKGKWGDVTGWLKDKFDFGIDWFKTNLSNPFKEMMFGDSGFFGKSGWFATNIGLPFTGLFKEDGFFGKDGWLFDNVFSPISGYFKDTLFDIHFATLLAGEKITNSFSKMTKPGGFFGKEGWLDTKIFSPINTSWVSFAGEGGWLDTKVFSPIGESWTSFAGEGGWLDTKVFSPIREGWTNFVKEGGWFDTNIGSPIKGWAEGFGGEGGWFDMHVGTPLKSGFWKVFGKEGFVGKPLYGESGLFGAKGILFKPKGIFGKEGFLFAKGKVFGSDGFFDKGFKSVFGETGFFGKDGVLFKEGGFIDKTWKGFTTKVLDPLKSFATDMYKGFKTNVLAPTVDFIKTEVWQPLKDTVSKDWARMKEWSTKNLIDPLKNTLKPFTTELKFQFENMKSWFKEDFMNGVKATMSTAGDMFNDMFAIQFGKSFSDMMKENVLQPIKDSLTTVKEAIGNVLGKVLKAPIDAFKAMSGRLKERHGEMGLLRKDGDYRTGAGMDKAIGSAVADRRAGITPDMKAEVSVTKDIATIKIGDLRKAVAKKGGITLKSVKDLKYNKEKLIELLKHKPKVIAALGVVKVKLPIPELPSAKVLEKTLSDSLLKNQEKSAAANASRDLSKEKRDLRISKRKEKREINKISREKSNTASMLKDRERIAAKGERNKIVSDKKAAFDIAAGGPHKDKDTKLSIKSASPDEGFGAMVKNAKFTDKIFKFMQRNLGGVSKTVKNIAKKMGINTEGPDGQFDDTKGFFGQMMDKIKRPFVGIGEKIKNFVSDIAAIPGKMLKAAKDVLSHLSEVIGDVAYMFKDIADMVGSIGKALVDTVGPAIKATIEGAWGVFKTAGQAAWKGVELLAEGTWNAIKLGGQGLWEGLKLVADPAMKALKGLGEGAMWAGKQLFSAFGFVGKKLLGGAATVAKKSLGAASGIAKKLFRGKITNVKIVGISKSVVFPIRKATDPVTIAEEKIAGKLKGGVSTGISKLKGLFKRDGSGPHGAGIGPGGGKADGSGLFGKTSLRDKMSDMAFDAKFKARGLRKQATQKLDGIKKGFESFKGTGTKLSNLAGEAKGKIGASNKIFKGKIGEGVKSFEKKVGSIAGIKASRITDAKAKIAEKYKSTMLKASKGTRSVLGKMFKHSKGMWGRLLMFMAPLIPTIIGGVGSIVMALMGSKAMALAGSLLTKIPGVKGAIKAIGKTKLGGMLGKTKGMTKLTANMDKASKATAGITKGATKVSKLGGLLTKLKDKLPKRFGKLLKPGLISNITKKLGVKTAAKLAGRLLGPIGWGIAIASGAKGAYDGYKNADEIMGVGPEHEPLSVIQKAGVGAAGALSSVLLDLVPTSFIAGAMGIKPKAKSSAPKASKKKDFYDLSPSQRHKMMKLDPKDRSAYFNEATGNKTDQKDSKIEKKGGLFSKVRGAVKSVGKFVGGGGIIGMGINKVKDALSGGNAEKPSFLTKTKDSVSGLMGKTKAWIKGHEGLSLQEYKDSVGKSTIGYGHLNREGMTELTKSEADKLFDYDFDKHYKEAEALPGFMEATPVQRAGLVNMVFNMGRAGVTRFKKMLGALQSGNAKETFKQAMSSKWASQVGKRASEVSKVVAFGKMEDIKPKSIATYKDGKFAGSIKNVVPIAGAAGMAERTDKVASASGSMVKESGMFSKIKGAVKSVGKFAAGGGIIGMAASKVKDLATGSTMDMTEKSASLAASTPKPKAPNIENKGEEKGMWGKMVSLLSDIATTNRETATNSKNPPKVEIKMPEQVAGGSKTENSNTSNVANLFAGTDSRSNSSSQKTQSAEVVPDSISRIANG